jgi:histone deacetylase complex regulatory component SIN3
MGEANGDISKDSIGQSDDGICNNNNSSNGGSGTDNHNVSDLRSTLPSKRTLEEQQMTLEGRQLRKVLQQGQPTLIQQIRQHIGQHDTFQSFLELLTMYEAHLIDHLELVRRASPFLGRDQPLLDRFKRGIMDDRVDDGVDTRANDALIMSPSIQPSPSSSTPSATNHNSNKDNSTSYRWIPKAVRE